MTPHELDVLIRPLAVVADHDLTGFPPPGLAAAVVDAIADDPTPVTARPATIDAHPVRHDPPATRRRRRSLAVACVVLVAALAPVAIGIVADDTETRVGRRVEVTPTPAAPDVVPAARCGSTFPQALNVPDGLAGPATTVTDTGQLRMTWGSPTGTFEARWPADPDLATSVVPRPGAVPVEAPPLSGGSTGPEIAELPDGRFTQYRVFWLSQLAGPDTTTECETWQWRYTDSSRDRVAAVTAHMASPFRTDPALLVVGSRAVDVVPAAATCATPPGAAPVPNRRVQLDTGPYPTARDALRAVLEGEPTFPDRGYVELRLPDGSLGYGWEIPVRGGFAVVVSTSPGTGGWYLDGYDASGC